jgi:hypothetical protein
MGPHSHDGSTLTWRRINTQRWETEQRCDGAPCFTATRARGTWRLRPGSSTQVIGGFRTIDDIRSYAGRLLSDAA